MDKKTTEKLMAIYNALNQLETRGEQNLTILVGCMNELKSLIKGGVEENGNSNA